MYISLKLLKIQKLKYRQSTTFFQVQKNTCKKIKGNYMFVIKPCCKRNSKQLTFSAILQTYELKEIQT